MNPLKAKVFNLHIKKLGGIETLRGLIHLPRSALLSSRKMFGAVNLNNFADIIYVLKPRIHPGREWEIPYIITHFSISINTI